MPRTASRLEDLRIGVGETTLAPELGSYYLDFSGVVSLVEAQFHGQLDPAGVPLTRTATGEQVYQCCTIAQYALALQGEFLKHSSPTTLARLKTQLDALRRLPDQGGRWDGLIVNRRNHDKYRLIKPPWLSALDLGNAISALLRGAPLLGDVTLVDSARGLLAGLARPIREGGVACRDACGHLWLEEYPMDPPCHVLNGFIFALWGVLDYARVTGDECAWEIWHAGLETLRAHLGEYDCGYWSRYDLRFRELASVHYHRQIHVPQLAALHGLTADPLFADYSRRWQRFGSSTRSLVRRWLMVRWEARQRGRRFE